MKKGRWNDSETDFLTQHYPRKGKLWCAKQLNREPSSVRSRAARLKLRKDLSSPYHRSVSERHGDLLRGKKRPAHSLLMKERGTRGELWLQKHPKIKHGVSTTRAYSIWSTMLRRCNNKSHSSYSNYGARGISVCDEWQDVLVFKRWFDSRYKKGLSIDRIDVNGNYCPQNCRMVTSATQGQNKRNNVVNKAQVAKIRELARMGMSQRRIANEMGVSFKNINNIVLNKTWKTAC